MDYEDTSPHKITLGNHILDKQAIFKRISAIFHS